MSNLQHYNTTNGSNTTNTTTTTISTTTATASYDVTEKTNYEKILKYSENSIIFEDNFDILFNKSGTQPFNVNEDEWKKLSKLEQQADFIFPEKMKGASKIKIFTGGLIVPSKNSCGSGNIVIIGEPGTGKSTLLFQMAAICTSNVNNGIAVYYSLEQSREEVINNFVKDSELDKINKLDKYIPYKNDYLNKSKWFDSILNQNYYKDSNNKDHKMIKCQILFPIISPRGVQSNDKDNLFDLRYNEIEMLLIECYKHNEKSNVPKIKLFAFDGLNVFAEKLLTREEMSRLFELFKKYKILGVFTIEDSSYTGSNRTEFCKNAEYCADVVISLSSSNLNNYYLTYIEIKKSRYIAQVTGKQPYKIKPVSNDNKSILKKKLEVYMSLHYLFSATRDLSRTDDNRLEKNDINEDISDNITDENILENNNINEDIIDSMNEPKNIFGIKALDEILPKYISDIPKKHSQIISISGKGGLYKSDLAINALLYGMCNIENGSENNDALIIRLSDKESFDVDGVRLCDEVHNKIIEFIISNKKVNKNINTNLKISEIDAKQIKLIEINKKNLIQDIGDINQYKCSLRGWEFNKINKNEMSEFTNILKKQELANIINEPKLLELTFKSGALLPEEFFEILYNVIGKNKIGRIAFLGLKVIGVSYPLLCKSESSGELFLTALEQISRKFMIHLIVSTPDTNVIESQIAINKMIELADTNVTISLDEKHDNIVYISGVGNRIKGDKYKIHDKGNEIKNEYNNDIIINSSCFKIENNNQTTPELTLFGIDKKINV